MEEQYKKTFDQMVDSLKMYQRYELKDKNRKDIVNKTAARVFQALRIEVNQEFEVLYEFVEKLPHILKPGGRVAILTFHSGEDRIV